MFSYILDYFHKEIERKWQSHALNSSFLTSCQKLRSNRTQRNFTRVGGCSCSCTPGTLGERRQRTKRRQRKQDPSSSRLSVCAPEQSLRFYVYCPSRARALRMGRESELSLFAGDITRTHKEPNYCSEKIVGRGSIFVQLEWQIKGSAVENYACKLRPKGCGMLCMCLSVRACFT